MALCDGEELVCELDAAGNPVAGVVFGANGLLVYGTTGYQFDPQGNAAHLMDDDGLVLAHLAYDAWGQPMSGNNPTPYGYKGQWGYYTDGETGLPLLTHRYLDPATGRFLTRDPFGVEGGINLYADGGNGVVVKADPEGYGIVDVCLTVAYLEGHKVRNVYGSDKLAHCVAACRARRCGTIVTSWIGGICKEIGDWLHPLDSDTWAPNDLAANHEGELCAKRQGDCLSCCLRKYPAKPRPPSQRFVPKPLPIPRWGIPPEVPLPGECIRQPNGKVVCG